MSAERRAALEAEQVLGDLVGLDPALVRQRYYGERSIFYNPGGTASLGVMFASIKDDDGPNDRSSDLSRPNVYRFAFQISPGEYARRFGPIPARPPKGLAVAVGDHDPTRLDVLTPHPVYAWMRWAQILSPTPASFESLRPLLAESLAVVRDRWRRRESAR